MYNNDNGDKADKDNPVTDMGLDKLDVWCEWLGGEAAPCLADDHNSMHPAEFCWSQNIPRP